MAKNNNEILSALINLAVWFTGILVSLAVGFSMIEKGALNQSIPWLSQIGDGIIVSIAGWIVIILTTISIVLAIIHKIK